MKFLLKKGNHYSIPKKIKIYMHTKEFQWKVKFSKECWYERGVVEFTGYNKLRGVTFGTHQENPWGKWKLTKWLVNSALLAWQPNFNDPEKKKINLYLYYDVNGVEYRQIFNSVNIEEEFLIGYTIKKNGVYISINNGKEYHMPTKTWLKLGYHLWPYFGGKSTAPHDMNVTID